MTYFIIIRGPLGSGKTTISKDLARKLHAKYFSIDGILEDHHLTHDFEDGMISRRSFLKINDLVFPEAQKELESNRPVIFDGNFYWKEQIEDLVSRLPYEHYIFTLHTPLKVCIERDSKRKHPHGKDATTAVYRAVKKVDYGIPTDNSTSTDKKVVDKILSYLF